MADRIVTKPNTGPGKKIVPAPTGLNANVKAADAPKVIKALQARKDAGSISKNDQARLDDLVQKYPSNATPSTPANPGDPNAPLTPPPVDPALKNPDIGPDGKPNLETTSPKLKQDVQGDQAANNPNATDAFGNTHTITYDANGVPTVTNSAGQLGTTLQSQAQAAAAGYQDPNALRAGAQDAAYNTLTQHYGTQESKEMMDAKQELADRGIPYDPAAAQDPNTQNQYGRTLQGIDQKYQGLYNQASQQAINAGNSIASTQSGIQNSAVSTLGQAAASASGNFQPYQGNSNNAQYQNDLLNMSSQDFQSTYGQDQATARQNSQNKTAVQVAGINKQKTGGAAKAGSGAGTQTGGFDL